MPEIFSEFPNILGIAYSTQYCLALESTALTYTLNSVTVSGHVKYEWSS